MRVIFMSDVAIGDRECDIATGEIKAVAPLSPAACKNERRFMRPPNPAFQQSAFSKQPSVVDNGRDPFKFRDD